jgi:hypothetical protein
MSDLLRVTKAPVMLDTGITSKCALPHNQQVLMDLLIDHMERGSAITMDDICGAYLKTEHSWGRKGNRSNKSRTVFTWSTDGTGKMTYTSVPIDRPEARWQLEHRAMCWFRMNLGSCIVKGRLVAIPVIEASDPDTGQ